MTTSNPSPSPEALKPMADSRTQKEELKKFYSHPEEKCERLGPHEWRWSAEGTDCRRCGVWKHELKSSPSPEARVDWKLKARESLQPLMQEAFKKYIIFFGQEPHGTNEQIGALLELGVFRGFAEALSEAFEKGREAR
jgi:hypothetical protein